MKKDALHLTPLNTKPPRHTDKQQTPRRVASRMEGVVKNTGTKKNKKASKQKSK